MLQSVTLLGPQRPTPNLPAVLEALNVTGPLVAITAGWRHDEAELADLEAAVGPVISLPLYRWFDRVPTEAPEVAATYEERQNRIKRFKELYRLRMHSALSTVRELVRMLPRDEDLVTPQIERAAQVVRGIDAEALAAVDEVRAAFTSLSERFDVPWVRDRRDEAVEAIAGAGAVLVAGGHVAVLRNRMLFFGLEHALSATLADRRPVIAWGAGAMVMTERIVLFYDDAPDGPAEAEILDHGMGFAPALVAFPHAKKRLRLDDLTRVAALAHRFGPNACVGLGEGAWIEQTAEGWRSRGEPGSALRLCPDGSTIPLEVR
jgi:peptidase E